MARSYDISKQAVWQAYQRVKTNKGAAGIDGQTIEDFETRPEREFVQNLEPTDIGQLSAPSGDGRRDSETFGWK